MIIHLETNMGALMVPNQFVKDRNLLTKNIYKVNILFKTMIY